MLFRYNEHDKRASKESLALNEKVILLEVELNPSAGASKFSSGLVSSIVMAYETMLDWLALSTAKAVRLQEPSKEHPRNEGVETR
jgi:hypothetical protein